MIKASEKDIREMLELNPLAAEQLRRISLENELALSKARECRCDRNAENLTLVNAPPEIEQLP